jgi:hypothetical protein
MARAGAGKRATLTEFQGVQTGQRTPLTQRPTLLPRFSGTWWCLAAQSCPLPSTTVSG